MESFSADVPGFRIPAGEFRTGREIHTLDALHDALEKDQDLLAVLDEGASAKKTEAAKALGISLADAAFINEHKEEYDKWKEEVATRRTNRELLESAPAKDRERRRQKLLATEGGCTPQGDRPENLDQSLRTLPARSTERVSSDSIATRKTKSCSARSALRTCRF